MMEGMAHGNTHRQWLLVRCFPHGRCVTDAAGQQLGRRPKAMMKVVLLLEQRWRLNYR